LANEKIKIALYFDHVMYEVGVIKKQIRTVTGDYCCGAVEQDY